MNTTNVSDLVPEEVTNQVTQQLTFFQKYFANIQEDLLLFCIKVFFAIIVLIVGLIIIHFIRKAIRRGLKRIAEKNNFSNVHFVDETIKYILYVVLIIVIAQYFGVSAASVVALLGSAGLTIGLAFQGALSNFAGGVLLLIHKPFKIGDYVIIGNNIAEGTVSNIGIIYTTLSIGDFKTIVVPNGTLANSNVTNLTPNNIRLLEMTFSISYSSDIEKAKALISSIIENDADVLKNKDYLVFISDLAESCVNIGARVYVNPANYINVKWRITEQVKISFDKNAISIPFNQLDVHIKSDND